MNNFTKFPFIAMAVIMSSCGSDSTTESMMIDTASLGNNGNGISIIDVNNSPEFSVAALTFGAVTASAYGRDSVKVSFNFTVKNYELMVQTSDAENKVSKNSAKGQHIHFVLDNKPYVALFEPKHEVIVAKNSEHSLLAFLSRSYHESLKNKDAAVVMFFKIDGSGKLIKQETPKTPMIFYSRPKGVYIGKDTQNLMFDFYVWNTTLAEGDYNVQANVKANGLDTTVNFTSWKPRLLSNMPLGKASITLTLLDKNGNKVAGPETEVTREFELAADTLAK